MNTISIHKVTSIDIEYKKIDDKEYGDTYYITRINVVNNGGLTSIVLFSDEPVRIGEDV